MGEGRRVSSLEIGITVVVMVMFALSLSMSLLHVEEEGDTLSSRPLLLLFPPFFVVRLLDRLTIFPLVI